jgi:hypothetical protein
MSSVTEALSTFGRNMYAAGAASSDQVLALSNGLGVPLPPSYIAFLERFGAVGLGATFISGILDNDALKDTKGSAFSDTRRFRASTGFPTGFIVISEHEDGAYCLDTARTRHDGECPVVNYEFGSVQHSHVLSRTFDDWVARPSLRAARR